MGDLFGLKSFLNSTPFAVLAVTFATLFVIFLIKSIKRGNRITELERLIKERDPELYKQIKMQVPIYDQLDYKPQGNV